MPISPGDKISAQVVYQGANQFFMELQDLTTGVTLTTTQTSNGAVDRSSAEWIVEAPGTDSGVLPLADFGSVTFTGASMTLDNNEGGPIGAFPNAQFGMLPETTGAVIATTSALDVTGSSFTVTSEVPEPSTLALLACCGLIGLVACCAAISPGVARGLRRASPAATRGRGKCPLRASPAAKPHSAPWPSRPGLGIMADYSYSPGRIGHGAAWKDRRLSGPDV